MCTIIGRKKETAELKRCLNSGRAELIAVYGRRRVGKTFLINEIFSDHIVFHHTGLSPYNKRRKVTLKDQLQNFYYSLIRQGAEEISIPNSWMEAFFMLERLLVQLDNGSRQVVFIDEMPWMDTPRSGFLTAFEGFWNGWGNTRHNLCLVVCGSATSWMLDNFIEDKGGLYGRVTHSMKLSPFTLKECEDFYADRGVKMSRYNIIQSYMVLGGIPYYMNYFNPSYSLAQNIDTLFFAKAPKLDDEFERLFNSIFDRASDCIAIVRALSKRRYGYTRDELAKMTGINPNGDFSKSLKALCKSDFIIRYVPFGYGKREEHYKLTDCFCWFWIHFKENKKVKETDYWQHHLKESEIASWRGIAFEEVCLQHTDALKHALGISGVSTRESAMAVRSSEDSNGMQIDLIIDRDDDIMNICEMKYTRSTTHMPSGYAATILDRMAKMETEYKNKTIHMTLVSTTPYDNASDTFQSVISIDDLFV